MAAYDWDVHVACWNGLDTGQELLMVDMVLQIVQQMAAGSVTVVGAEVGQAVCSAVRDRFAGTDSSREALGALDERPDDPAAAAAVRALLQAEVDADPDFAERLSALLAQQRSVESARVTTGSITLEGTTLRGRNTISLGPVSVSNTRNVRLSLLAVALCLAALVALGIYGGLRLYSGEDGTKRSRMPVAAGKNGSGEPDRGSTESHDEPAVTALPASVLHTVLPGLEDVAPRWSYHSPPDSITYDQDSSGQVAIAYVFYSLTGTDETTVWFSVTSYTDSAKAKAAFPHHVKDARAAAAPTSSSDLPQWTTKVLTPPDIGDRSWLGVSTSSRGLDGDRMSLVTRVDAVTIDINFRGLDGGPSEPDTAELTRLGRMMALRAEQGQNGRHPSAQLDQG
ncbi:hypothetical protein ABT112_32580 [Streptomyces sp. NPDC002055]|uniref:hypothetical protein n=1 Tax=Streptomyces sp. NPDC002055 TaxID=3154534 RepID=UPI00331DB4DD